MLKLAVLKTSPQGESAERPRSKTAKGESRPLSAEGEARPIEWWVPMSCRQRQAVSINGELVGTRCGSRACLDCHRLKLSRWVDVAGILQAHDGEVFRSCVLTPEMRCEDHEDVKKFLGSVRSFLRQWTRSAGLGFGFWVAEAVPKWDEEPSQIPCPLRKAAPVDFVEGCPEILRRSLSHFHETCVDGSSCNFCRGRGYLPRMHVHVHLLTSSLPFWYGADQPPKEKRQKYPARWIGEDGEYTGFQGACSRHGIGVSRAQKIRHSGGIRGYISKACLSYVSKGSKEVDHLSSAVNACLASWTFGRVRTRGAVGRAYGLTKRTKDCESRVMYVADREAAEKMSGQKLTGANTLHQALNGCVPEKAEPRKGEPRCIEVLEIGSKAQSAVNVLKKTQVYIGQQIETPKIYTKGKLKEIETRIAENQTLSAPWDGVAVVKDKDTWAIPADDLGLAWYVGRGASAIFIRGQIHKTKHLIKMMKAIAGGLPWVDWWSYNEQLTRRETTKLRVKYDQKTREMDRTISRLEPA